MKKTPKRALRYAVVRRWKENPGDFQVLEYFETKRECETYIATHPHHATDMRLEIARWE